MAEASIRHPRSNDPERVVQRTHIARPSPTARGGAMSAEESTMHVIRAEEFHRLLGTHEIGG